jgi:hypothetical protein
MIVSDLRSIALAGGSIVVDARQYNASDLRAIAVTGKIKGAKLFIKNAKTLSTPDCTSIALANPNNVEFDFSE